MEKIELKLFDLSIDRIKQAVAHYLELNHNHIIYHVECYVESQPNKEEGEYEVKERYIHYHACILKSAITAVDVDFDENNKDFECWVVEIMVTGMTSRIKIKCETNSEATILLNAIQNYLIRG